MLEDFSEAFGEGLGCFTYDLTAKDISYGVLDNLTFLVAIVASELREVLEAQADCHFVRACRGNEVVQATEVDVGSSSMMTEDLSCFFLLMSFTMREL